MGGRRTGIRLRLQDQLRTEIEPLLAVHGVELVALEWLQGPGRGILRVYIDRPGTDPRVAPAEGEGMSADLCARVSRDISSALDALGEEAIPGSYDLEVSSPGFERPVQKRADWERFTGLVAKVKTRVPVAGRGSFEGPIAGTVDRPDGGFAVRLTVDGTTMEIDARGIARAKLAELVTAKPAKPARAPRGPKPTKAPKATTPEAAPTGAARRG